MKPDYAYFHDCFVFQYQPRKVSDFYQQWLNIYTPVPLPLHMRDPKSHSIGVHVISGYADATQFNHVWPMRDGFRRMAPWSFDYDMSGIGHITLEKFGHTLWVQAPKNFFKTAISFAGTHVLRAVFIPAQRVIAPDHRAVIDAQFRDYLIGTRFAHAHNTACGYLRQEPTAQRAAL